MLEDSITGQEWLCGGCQIRRRTQHRNGALALLEVAQTTGSSQYAAGIAIAVKELTGAHLPAQREEEDTIIGSSRQAVRVRSAVPHLRLVITGVFGAALMVFGASEALTIGAVAGDPDPSVASQAWHPHGRRRLVRAVPHAARRPAPPEVRAGLLASGA